MKILHTADLHLREVGDERWSALETIVNICVMEKVDIFVICGDLFDTTLDAEHIRDGIRKFFSSGSFQTIIIPGNHDIDSFKKGFYFGEGVHILNEPNWSNNVIEFNDVRIIGLPFENIDAQNINWRLRELQTVINQNRTNILLYHGELLDTFFARGDFGPGEDRRYMPTRLSYFKELGVDYVLAGHFHTKFDIRELGKDKYFVYSGSPVSITKKELEQRAVNLFHDGISPQEYPLDTFHYLHIEIELNPLYGEKPIDFIRKRIARIHPNAMVLLTISGYVEQAEDKLVSEINSLIEGRSIDVEYQFKDISRVLTHSLFSKVNKILMQTDMDELRKEQIKKLAIRGMIEIGL